MDNQEGVLLNYHGLAGAGSGYVEFTREQATAGVFSSSGERLFTSAERIQLTLAKCQAPVERGGAGLHLDALVQRGDLSDWWALHDTAELAAMQQQWARSGTGCGAFKWVYDRLAGNRIGESHLDAIREYCDRL